MTRPLRRRESSTSGRFISRRLPIAAAPTLVERLESRLLLSGGTSASVSQVTSDTIYLRAATTPFTVTANGSGGYEKQATLEDGAMQTMNFTLSADFTLTCKYVQTVGDLVDYEITNFKGPIDFQAHATEIDNGDSTVWDPSDSATYNVTTNGSNTLLQYSTSLQKVTGFYFPMTSSDSTFAPYEVTYYDNASGKFMEIEADIPSPWEFDDTYDIGTTVTAPKTSQHLSFTTQPSNTPAGVPMVPVKVSIDNSDGTVDATDDSVVTISVAAASNPSTSLVSLTAQATNGVATFGNLAFEVGGSFVLTATDGSDANATSKAFQIGPVEIQGTFSGGKSSGTVQIGLVPALGAKFVPLLKESGGTVSYGTAGISVANGTISAAIASLKSPTLFTGSFTIPDGTMATSAFTVTNDLKVAGQLFKATGFSLSSTGILLHGALPLPAAFKPINLDLTGNYGLAIDSTGLHFQGKTVPVIEPVSVNFGGLTFAFIPTPNANLLASYDPKLDGIRLQGAFTVPIFPKAASKPQQSITVDFTGTHYIEDDVTNRLTSSGSIASTLTIPIIPNVITITGITLTWGAGEWGAMATVQLGKVESLTFGFSILNGFLNEVTIKFADLAIPLGDDFFLQSVSGTLDNLQSDPSLTADVLISLGTKISMPLPKALGGTIEGYLFSIYGELNLDSKLVFSASLTDSLLGDASAKTGISVSTDTISLDLNPKDSDYGALSFMRTVSILNGVFSMTGALTINAKAGTLDLSGTGSVMVPGFTWDKKPVGDKTEGSATMKLHIATAAGHIDLANSYFAGWAMVKYPVLGTILIGLEYNLLGMNIPLDPGHLPP